MNERLVRWLEDPDGGELFSHIRDKILEHDPACPTLNHVWMPRRNGRSCLSDWRQCHGCGIEFDAGEVLMAFEDCPESWHWYCVCCLGRLETCGCEKEEQ